MRCGEAAAPFVVFGASGSLESCQVETRLAQQAVIHCQLAEWYSACSTDGQYDRLFHSAGHCGRWRDY
jgi:hypothetical protein